MTGEPTYTASKERMAPELMFRLNARPSYHKLLQKYSGHYASISAMFSPLHSATVKEVPLQQSSHHENTTICTPPTINYCLISAAAILRFTFSYVQPIT